MNQPVPQNSAPAPRWTSVVKAVSISRSLLTSRTMSCCPAAEAAARASETNRSVVGNLGSTSTAMLAAPGRNSRKSQLLRRKFHRHEADARDIATGPVEVGDKAIPDRVEPGHEHDWYRRGCGLGRERRRGISDD